MATWTAAADAVKTVLQGAVDAAGGTLERRYYLQSKLEDLAVGSGPQVTVFVRAANLGRGTRGSWSHEPEVAVLVEQHVETDAETDAAATFVETLVSDLAKPTTPALLAAFNVSLLNVRVDPVYFKDALEQTKVFQSGLIVTLRTDMRYGVP